MKSLFFAALVGFATIGAAVGCTLEAEPNETPSTGTVSLDLRGTSQTGNVYRLRNATFTISTTPPTTLSSDGANLDAPTISQQLPAGSYLATLANGWILERQTALNVFSQVQATLVSQSSVMFGIVANQTTNLAFQFSTSGQVVTVGNGTLNITIGVTETDGGAGQPCTLFSPMPGCPAGQWCGPGPNGSPQGVCQLPGTAPIGGMCASTVPCVANAVCVGTPANPNAGFCRQICQPGGTTACPGGTVCTPTATMTFGVCQ